MPFAVSGVACSPSASMSRISNSSTCASGSPGDGFALARRGWVRALGTGFTGGRRGGDVVVAGARAEAELAATVGEWVADDVLAIAEVEARRVAAARAGALARSGDIAAIGPALAPLVRAGDA